MNYLRSIVGHVMTWGELRTLTGRGQQRVVIGSFDREAAVSPELRELPLRVDNGLSEFVLEKTN